MALSRLTKDAVEGSFTLGARIVFGHGCDCSSYVEGLSDTATNSMAATTYVEMVPDELLGVRGVAARQVRLLLYSSERANTGATHIQCCPREPQTPAADHQPSLANRVRRATASGYVGRNP